MEEVDIGTRKYTAIHTLDGPGPGGAYHEYCIGPAGGAGSFDQFAVIHFQKGPIKEAGVNGCHQEDLIAICIHRLESFQKGVFACAENHTAITKLREALHWLNQRTEDRVKRGVEGTDTI